MLIYICFNDSTSHEERVLMRNGSSLETAVTRRTTTQRRIKLAGSQGGRPHGLAKVGASLGLVDNSTTRPRHSLLTIRYFSVCKNLFS